MLRRWSGGRRRPAVRQASSCGRTGPSTTDRGGRTRPTASVSFPIEPLRKARPRIQVSQGLGAPCSESPDNDMGGQGVAGGLDQEGRIRETRGCCDSACQGSRACHPHGHGKEPGCPGSGGGGDRGGGLLMNSDESSIYPLSGPAGKSTLADGSYYIGWWRDGQRHGKGAPSSPPPCPPFVSCPEARAEGCLRPTLAARHMRPLRTRSTAAGSERRTAGGRDREAAGPDSATDSERGPGSRRAEALTEGRRGAQGRPRGPARGPGRPDRDVQAPDPPDRASKCRTLLCPD